MDLFVEDTLPYNAFNDTQTLDDIEDPADTIAVTATGESCNDTDTSEPPNKKAKIEAVNKQEIIEHPTSTSDSTTGTSLAPCNQQIKGMVVFPRIDVSMARSAVVFGMRNKKPERGYTFQVCIQVSV